MRGAPIMNAFPDAQDSHQPWEKGPLRRFQRAPWWEQGADQPAPVPVGAQGSLDALHYSPYIWHTSHSFVAAVSLVFFHIPKSSLPHCPHVVAKLGSTFSNRSEDWTALSPSSILLLETNTTHPFPGDKIQLIQFVSTKYHTPKYSILITYKMFYMLNITSEKKPITVPLILQLEALSITQEKKVGFFKEQKLLRTQTELRVLRQRRDISYLSFWSLQLIFKKHYEKYMEWETFGNFEVSTGLY